jgi:hypothetical protein
LRMQNYSGAYYNNLTFYILNSITPAIKDVNKYYSNALDSGTRALQGIRRNDGNSALLLPE